MVFDQQRRQNGKAPGVGGLIFTSQRLIGCRLRPLTATRLQIDPKSQQFCTGRLPDECRSKRFNQQLFVVAILFLGHENSGETLQFRQRLRRIAFSPFAQQRQCFPKRLLRFFELTVGGEGQTQAAQRIQ